MVAALNGDWRRESTFRRLFGASERNESMVKIKASKHGKPVRSDCTALIGRLKRKLKIKGDVQSTGIVWRAKR